MSSPRDVALEAIEPWLPSPMKRWAGEVLDAMVKSEALREALKASVCICNGKKGAHSLICPALFVVPVFDALAEGASDGT